MTCQGDGSFDRLSSRFAEKQSDRVASRVKDHHCVERSEATGGHDDVKVTHVRKKRSDISAAKAKDHHCVERSKATGGHDDTKVTHVRKKGSDQRA